MSEEPVWLVACGCSCCLCCMGPVTGHLRKGLQSHSLTKWGMACHDRHQVHLQSAVEFCFGLHSGAATLHIRFPQYFFSTCRSPKTRCDGVRNVAERPLASLSSLASKMVPGGPETTQNWSKAKNRRRFIEFAKTLTKTQPQTSRTHVSTAPRSLSRGVDTAK